MNRPLRIKYIVGISLLISVLLLVLRKELYAAVLPAEYFHSKVFVLAFSRILFWICLSLLWLYTKRVEKQDLLLWKDRRYSLLQWIKYSFCLLAVVFFSMLLMNLFFHFIGIKEKSKVLEMLINIFRSNKFLLWLTVITAGVTEELLHRGYIQPRLEILFKSSSAAIFISSLIFGLMHFGYGTMINMAGPFIIGIIFACFYYKYRNIKILMLCHFLWDFLGILLIMKQQAH